jgi:hypothetical protein
MQSHLYYSEDGNSKDNVGKLHKETLVILHFAIQEIRGLTYT